ncbi:MAG: oligosaccharide flippase family protein [bacterium]|nr:oligosaccharide flippase family protein [bacterium]
MPLCTDLRNVLRHDLIRNIFKVLTGNVGGNLLNFIALLLLVRALGKETFGLFTTLQAAMMLMAQLSDFGLNTTLVKYYREAIGEGRPDEAEVIMRRSLWLRLAIIGVVAGGCAALAHPIARHLIRAPEAAGLLRWCCLGAGGALLWSYCQGAMQAREQFGWYSLLTPLNHAVRLGLVGGLLWAGRLNLPAAVGIMVAVPFFGAAGAGFLWPRRFWTARIGPEALRRRIAVILRFSKWIFLSTVTVSIVMRLDILMLSYFSDKGEVAQFGVAERLAQIFPLVTLAISTVVLPRLAATRRRREMERAMAVFRRMLPLLLAGVVVVMPAAHWLIPRLLGADFSPAAWVFDILILGFVLEIVINPLSYFCLAFNRAQWLSGLNGGQLLLNVAIGVLLIPPLGAIGAAFGSLMVRLLALVYVSVTYRRLWALAESDES